MKKGLSEIVCIIDRSGSMATIRDDAIGGFNTFLAEQKKLPGEARLTLILFDDEYIKLYDGMNIQDVPDLNETTYIPRGMTALLDAIGKTITAVGERLRNTPEDERPEKVIVPILTDGMENDSKEYKSKDKIFKMVNHQKDVYKWEFIYLAANQDAVQEGTNYGINAKDCFNFVASGIGTRAAYSSMNATVKSYRNSK